MGLPKTLMPRPKSSIKKTSKIGFGVIEKLHIGAAAAVAVLVLGFFSLPAIVSMDIEGDMAKPAQAPFPISVNPHQETIIEDPAIEALLAEEPTTLTASVGILDRVTIWLADKIASVPLYSQLSGADQRFVTIYPGYREEEVARAFGGALGWSLKERSAFLKQVYSNPPVLTEGQFQPGTYTVSTMMTPDEVQIMIYDRFSKEILERYSTTTAALVPLEDALIIASLIEREAGGWHDMRDISGILWNRLFAKMNLQIDATLQYAKATGKNGVWWPKPVPDDKYIKSKYNTYKNPGLPPAPIANPSVAAVVAALNPKVTDCMFYFHDARGGFHCSPTYEGHVKMLKQYYGRGK